MLTKYFCKGSFGFSVLGQLLIQTLKLHLAEVLEELQKEQANPNQPFPLLLSPIIDNPQ